MWFQDFSKDLKEGFAEFGQDIAKVSKYKGHLERFLLDADNIEEEGDEDAERREGAASMAQQLQQHLEELQQKQQEQQQQRQQQPSVGSRKGTGRPLPFGKELRSSRQQSKSDAAATLTSPNQPGSSSALAAQHAPTTAGQGSNTDTLTPPRPRARITPRSSPSVPGPLSSTQTSSSTSTLASPANTADGTPASSNDFQAYSTQTNASYAPTPSATPRPSLAHEPHQQQNPPKPPPNYTPQNAAPSAATSLPARPQQTESSYTTSSTSSEPHAQQQGAHQGNAMSATTTSSASKADAGGAGKLDQQQVRDRGGTQGQGTGSSNGLVDEQPRNEEELRRAYHQMKDAYGEMKQLLMKSMAECLRLSKDVDKLEGQVQASEASLIERAAAERAAKEETASLRCEVEKAQREAQANQSRPAEADASHLEALSQELAAAVRKIAVAVEAQEAAEERVAAAEASRAQAEAARKEADRMRWEAQAEAHAAVAAAEAERSTRAEAEGATETLRQEQERRARVFHNAVRAAVGRVQEQLERERDELQSQLFEVQKALEEARADLRSSQFAAEEAHIEASRRRADAEAAGHLAAAAEAAARRAAAREAEVNAAAQSAEEKRAVLVQTVQQLQQQLEEAHLKQEAAVSKCAELEQQLTTGQATQAARAEALGREVQVYRERSEICARALQNAERQLESLQASVRDVEARAAAEVALVQKSMQELEAEVQQLRTSGGVMSMFAMPSREDVLSGLGLKDGHLIQLIQGSSSPDLESNAAAKPQGKGRAAAARVLGIVPLRIVLMCLYLLVLHITVMVSFTRSNDLDRLCAGASKGSPLSGASALQHGKELP